MSSTNRGYSRHQSDYYVTPQQPIKEFLSAFLYDETDASGDYIKILEQPDKALWLDPCAGGDSKNAMSYPQVITELFEPPVMATMDIRDDSLAELKADYLQTEVTGYNIIITNPPFYLALPIIQKALKDVNENGYVIMLLRLNFLGSKARFDFWSENMPKYIYVHHRRMSFNGGATDSIEYAHFVWQKGYKPDHAKLRII